MSDRLAARREHRRLRRDEGEIGCDIGVNPATGPLKASKKHRLKLAAVPNVLTMAHAGEPDPPLAMVPSPGERVGRTLVVDASHSARLHQ